MSLILETNRTARDNQRLKIKSYFQLRNAQINSVLNLAPIVLATSLIMGGLLLGMYRDNLVTSGLEWMTAFIVTMAVCYGARILQQKKQLKAHSERNLKKTTFTAFAAIHLAAVSLGLVWGWAVFLFCSDSFIDFKIPVVVSFAVIMMTGSVVFAVIPSAVVTFIVPMMIGAALAIGAEPWSPVTAYLGIMLLWITVLTPALAAFYAKQFEQNVARSEKVKEHGAIVSMLLNELQENSSDWIWESDAEGMLLRFPDAILQRDFEPSTVNLSEFLARVALKKDDNLNLLRRSLANHEAFKNIAFCVHINNQETWLRLSGHPIMDMQSNVVGFLGTGSDVTAEKKAEERINKLAHFDHLTGLRNRGAFSERLALCVANMEHHGQPFTVLYVDLDEFKMVNDTRGHLFGDRLLAAVSTRMQEELREQDCIARLGGDEFAILVENQADEEAISRLANRLITEVSKPYVFDGEQASIGLSVGIALAPKDGERPDQLLRNADLALYRAKADGRGVFRLFEADMDLELREERLLETELREAVSNNELLLHFQPVVDAQTNLPVSLEALIRWNHPTRGLLSPGEFIQLAERSHLICDIGTWTLQSACRAAVDWPNSLSVAVNLSANYFMQSDIVEEISKALRETGLAPERLEIEITETLLIQDPKEVSNTIIKLKKLGIRIAMDDFGTGYSSLSYLMNVPFDKLKIDKSFIDAIFINQSGQKIIRMITTLARELNLQVTAEGVETEQQAAFLRQVGCDSLQGYLFEKPLCEEKLPLYFLNSMEKIKPINEVSKITA